MIRAALPADAPEIAKLIILAMDDLAMKFTGGSDPHDAIPLFEKFAALPDNQYSYEHILIYENENEICGMICAYDGGRLERLRKPFLDHLNEAYGFKYHPEDETGQGEYYIDCLSVSPFKQGRGIGKELITAMVKYAAGQHQQITGLLVNKENPKAAKLYTSLGFNIVKEKDFMGGKYFHMQYYTDV